MNSTDKGVPLSNESFKKMLRALLKHWWPLEGKHPKNPGRLNDAQFDAFDAHVKDVSDELQPWAALSSWFSQQANAWQSWDSKPPDSDAYPWADVRDEAEGEIVKLGPVCSAELAVFKKIIALA